MAKTAAKPAAKKPAPRRDDIAVHVEVLQNGATLLSTVMPLRHHGSLALSSASSGQLALPHYPLPDGRLEFLSFNNAGANLVVDYKWEGFCTSAGELTNISRRDRGRRYLPMKRGDYASITYDDLRLMVKLAPRPPKKAKGRLRVDKPYRAKPWAHFYPSAAEIKAAAVGALLVAIILGGAVAGLMQRHLERPTRLAEINEEYVLPFVAPDHLLDSPEALQEQLDRRQPVRSVLGYYGSVTSTLMGWPDYEPRYLYPTTISMYGSLVATAQAEGRDKLERQLEVDKAQQQKEGVGLLTIPAVIGESMTGSMMRVIDKIDILEHGLTVDLAAKRDIIQSFNRDPEYSWEEYKNATGKDQRAKEFFSQVKVFGEQTDEEQMYTEATNLAARARNKQLRIRHGEGDIAVTPESVRPIAMPDGVTFSSFATDLDFRQADDKLMNVHGSELGAPHPGKRIASREPLVGEIEPGLVEHYIRENRYQLQLCYELALRRNEAAAGTMEWRWRIDTRGLISELALVSNSIRDSRMSECVRQKISQWRFPRPRRGSVEVSFPFEFAPAKG